MVQHTPPRRSLTSSRLRERDARQKQVHNRWLGCQVAIHSEKATRAEQDETARSCRSLRSLADAAIAALAVTNRYDVVATFDRKLAKRTQDLGVSAYW